MKKSLQIQSLVTDDGWLEASLHEVEVPEPGPDQVVIRVDATPINPSDIGPLFGPADASTAEQAGTDDRPAVRARVSPQALKRVAGRVGHSLPVGNEGAGEVVAAGNSEAAQALLGKTVGAFSGTMYSEYQLVGAAFCIPLGEGVSAAEGASCFVNPLTVLSMIENMRLDGHTAIVHTAAASNLGQMLNRVCQEEGIPLVNVVRREEQVDLLRAAGAKYVCNSSEESFTADLTDAIAETGATLAFDALGGGRTGSQILSCMERAALRNATSYSGYGSTTHKQLFIYGSLDETPTELTRTYGTAWGVGGWLLTPFLSRVGFEKLSEMRARIARDIKTTFKSEYTKRITLREALQLENVRGYVKRATGEKYLITPNG